MSFFYDLFVLIWEHSKAFNKLQECLWACPTTIRFVQYFIHSRLDRINFSNWLSYRSAHVRIVERAKREITSFSLNLQGKWCELALETSFLIFQRALSHQIKILRFDQILFIFFGFCLFSLGAREASKPHCLGYIRTLARIVLLLRFNCTQFGALLEIWFESATFNRFWYSN